MRLAVIAGAAALLVAAVPAQDPARRLAAALALLRDPVLDALIASPICFNELPAAMSKIFAGELDSVCPLIRYPAGRAL